MSLASRKLIQATAGATTVDTGDDDFANVVLLLDGDGTSDDDNNTFTDSSTNGFTVTENGSVLQGSFSPYGDNWSNYFDGSGDGLSIATDSALDWGTSTDFTMECWFYSNVAVTSNTILFDTRNTSSAGSGVLFGINSSSKLVLVVLNNFDITGTTSIEAGQWYHLAVVRNSETFEVFIDGVSEGTSSTSRNIQNANGVTVGGKQLSSTSYDSPTGYISNARVVSGTAVYTSAYSPPTSPLSGVTNTTLLTCQSNRFVDNSSSSRTVTVTGTPKVTPFSPFKNDDARDITTDGGSAYFNYGPYLTLPQNTAFNFGTGDFTVEFWANVDTYRTSGSFFDALLTFGFYTSSPYFRIAHNGTLACGLVSAEYNSTSTIDTGEWNHYAITRSGTTLRIFVNGTLETTATNSANLGNSAAVTIGTSSWQAANEEMKGYLSDVRIVKGTAVYTSSFTPPTAPLTAVTNTSALLNFQDAGIYDRSGINNLDTVGDARLGFAPIYGTGSLAFDGTGDAVENLNADVVIGSGDFTVEAWVNFSSTNQDCILSTRLSTGTSNGFLFTAYQNKVQLFSGGSFILTGTTTLTTGQWYHIAIAREGSTLRLFVDGSLEDSTTNSTNYSDTYLRVGRDTNSSYDFSGYMDDFRITKGVARYTSAFTPPDEIDLSTDTHREYVTLFLDGDGTVNGQNNTFTDSSTNDFTVTENGSVVQGVFSPYGDNWSNYFDGSGDYLGSSSSSDFAFGTGDFTAEFWFYATSTPSASNIFDTRNGSAGWAIQWSGGTIKFYSEPSSSTLKQSSTLNADEWYHVAAVRNGTDFDLYVNGTAVGSSATDSSDFTANTVTLGARYSRNQQYFPGYISNVRLVKGTAVYTSNFTVPTSPLTAVTNTKLLTCALNNFSDGSSSDHALTPSGNTSVTRFSPFESNKPYDITSDGGSGYFDLSTSYLTYSGGSSSVSDITISFWVYVTGSMGVNGGLYPRIFASAYGALLIYTRDDDIRIYNGGEKLQTPIIQNEWHHFVAQRTSNTWEMWLDGDSKGTASDSTAVNLNTTNYIGRDTSDAGYFGGYISDFKITEGSEGYSGNFTPPSSPVGAGSSDLLLKFQDSAIPDLSGLNNIDTVGNAKVGGTDPTKYGSNAMQFDGSGDYLEIDSDNAQYFQINNADFTAEFWANGTANGTQIFCGSGTINNTSATNWWIETVGGVMKIYIASGGSFTVISDTVAFSTYSGWVHVAFVNSSGTSALYMNGTRKATATTPSTNTATCPFWVGGSSSGYVFDGYIDDLRVSKGIARYTGASFTPPDEALKKF